MAENVYSELACTACPAKSCRLGRSRELCRSVEPILYYGDNYEHRTGKAIHKRGPLGFPGYNRWPYFLFNLSACPCFCPCQSVFLSVPVRVYEILRRYIEDESVDLVHLDPPFKSDHAYNILFAERLIWEMSDWRN